MTPHAEALEECLRQLADLLQDGDGEAAAQQLSVVLDLCSQIGTERLPPDTVARCLALASSCEQRMLQLREETSGELQRAANNRRAIDRYLGG